MDFIYCLVFQTEVSFENGSLFVLKKDGNMFVSHMSSSVLNSKHWTKSRNIQGIYNLLYLF
jgi:hypothetical protein